MNEEEQYLDAARKIREDPDLPDAFAPELDDLIERAASRNGDERSMAIDALILGLRRDDWTREQLEQLTSGGERGVTWTDGELAGEDRGQSPLLEFTCRASGCGYTNKLAYRPPRGNMPECQNPDKPRHTLVL